MANRKQTSPKVASTAGKLLGKKGTPKPVKKVAASALAQASKAKKSKKR